MGTYGTYGTSWYPVLVLPGAAHNKAEERGALDLREVHGAAVARGQP